MQTGSQLRSLFATLLLHCHPTTPGDLWNQFKDNICDDLLRAIPRIYPQRQDPTAEDVFDYGLYLLNKVLIKSGKCLRDFPSMPVFVQNWGVIATNSLMQEQLDYDPVELDRVVATNVAKFNHGQKEVYNAVMASVDANLGGLFFLIY